MPATRNNNGNGISKLDYPGPGTRRPLLQPDERSDVERRSNDTSYAGSFFEQVAEGIQERDRALMRRVVTRYFSFFWAVIAALCAGSVTTYSLYGHLFQSRLGYSQYHVNVISVVAELGLYLPVPAFGYLCDRSGPGVTSLSAGLLLGFGYLLAAFTYRSGPPASSGGDGWPLAVMVIAFAAIGTGSSAMYLAAVTTCAKNFGRGKYKGLALSIAISAVGLSGVWQSQVGSRLLFERRADGNKGDVDVYRFFLFLGITLLVVGLVGSVALKIIDEAELIEEAIDELEQSGVLEENEFFRQAAESHGYGTMDAVDLSESTFSLLQHEADALKAREEEEKRKKNWLLNVETRKFLSDRGMWWLASGFVLVVGPGEAFINNMGTIIGTLYDRSTRLPSTSPATHVSIVAIASTAARIIAGTLSDLLAPVATPHQHYRSLENSVESLRPQDSHKFTLSRMAFVIGFAMLSSVGQVVLASGLCQDHEERFGIVSLTIGASYGAIFSLVPVIISVVWGVENFGTNWGIVAMTPAAGATLWSAIYAAVYQNAADKTSKGHDVCYGTACYAPTFWAMAASVWIACGLWLWAWRGPGGWVRKGITV